MIRVDDDSSFHQPIPYNIVDVMTTNNAEYGFRVLGGADGIQVTRGLAEAAAYWTTVESVEPTFLYEFSNNKAPINTDTWDRRTFSNNFFVTKISFWMQPHVRGWLHYIESLNGFYKFRWGDAPVQTLTTGIFLARDKVVEFDFMYQHSTWPESQVGQRTSTFKQVGSVEATPNST